MIYAQIANDGVLQTRDADESPGPDWRPVADSPLPEFDPATQRPVQTGWEITPDSARPLWAVITLPAPDAPVVLSGTNPVPTTIPLWSFRTQLELRGYLPAVEALLAALPEPDKTVAGNQWEFGNFIDRQHPMILACAQQLGLSPATVDEIFIAGGKMI